MGTQRGKSVLEQAIELVSQQLGKEPESVIVLLGPTASGKTALALALKQYFPLEIISADSRLVYKDMDIGTAKPTKEEQMLVPHHLIDLVSPEQRFTVADYQKAAFETIDDVFKRKKIPLLVGGTMLYIDAVIYNYQLSIINEIPSLKKKIRAMSLSLLQKDLLELVPDAPKYIDIQNPVRVMRTLEYYYLTGEWLWEKASKSQPCYHYLLLGLSIAKDDLKKRIAIRIEQQMRDGLVDEVKMLLTRYPHSEVAMTGIGYRQVIRYINGEYDEQAMIDQMNKDTLAYAKRQMTWWKRNKEIHWLQTTIEN